MIRRHQSGYSLVEILVVIATAGILAAMAVPLYDVTIRRSSADSAAQLIAQELSYARALAIGSRANVLVQFPANNLIAVAPGTGSERGPFNLPAGMRIMAGAFPPATPDNLGATVLGVGAFNHMTFLDNGSVVQDPLTNNLCSGTFYLMHTDGDPATRRAITLLGGTSRIHIWSFDPSSNTWK